MQINRFDNRQIAFLDHVRSYCKEHSKTVSLRPSGFLREAGGKCGGWCDGEELRVASRHPLALEILLHEFCHMMQAVEKDPLWVSPNPDYTYAIAAWNKKKEQPLGWTWKAIMHSIAIERDCEARSIKLIRQFKLPLKIRDYIAAANLNLYHYHYVFLKRKWGDSSSLYRPELLKLMPRTKLVPLEDFEYINMNLMQEFERVLGVN